MLSLIINRQILASSLSVASSVIKTRTPKPALACVRLEAAAKLLTVQATNLEQRISCSITQVQIEQPGICVVSCEGISAYIAAMTDATVRMHAEGSQLVIDGDAVRFKLDVANPEEFPPNGAVEKGDEFNIANAEFVRIVETVAMCTAADPGRYTNGIFFDTQDGKLRTVATDGRRLAMATTSVTATGSGSAIVPTGPLKTIAKIASEDPEGFVSVTLSERGATFACGDCVLSTVLIEGVFPPYMSIIPDEKTRDVVVNRESFAAAMSQAMLGSEEKTPSVRVVLSGDGISIIGRRSDREAVVKFPCKWEGPTLELGINAKFVSECLRPLECEEVTIRLLAPHRPITFSSPGWDCLIMPVNLT